MVIDFADMSSWEALTLHIYKEKDSILYQKYEKQKFGDLYIMKIQNKGSKKSGTYRHTYIHTDRQTYRLSDSL